MSVLHELRKAFLDGNGPSTLAESGDKILALRDFMLKWLQAVDMLGNRAERLRSLLEDKEEKNILDSRRPWIFESIKTLEVNKAYLRKILPTVEDVAKFFQSIVDAYFGHSVNIMENLLQTPYDPVSEFDCILADTMVESVTDEDSIPSVSEMKDRIADIVSDSEVLRYEAEVIRNRLASLGHIIKNL